MTSTLQQEGSRKLRLTAPAGDVAGAAAVRERLHHLHADRLDDAVGDRADRRPAQARELYGADYVPDAPRRYERKVKNAQEAHEAIRPAGDSFRTPASVRAELGNDEYRLYELIWQRTVARRWRTRSALGDGAGRAATSSTGEDASSPRAARSSRSPASCGPTSRRPTTPSRARRPRAPAAAGRARRNRSTAAGIEPQSHSTSPPARYTEASLVKALEELGIGRPSTYASILGTIQDRGYVFKRGTALVPSFTAFAVVGLLEQHFGRLVDYGFTASMEDDLDAIASGTAQSADWLTRFYFGDETARRRGRPARAEGAGRGPARRDRCPRGQLAADRCDRGRRAGRRPGRSLRPVRPEGRGPARASRTTCRPTS